MSNEPLVSIKRSAAYHLLTIDVNKCQHTDMPPGNFLLTDAELGVIADHLRDNAFNPPHIRPAPPPKFWRDVYGTVRRINPNNPNSTELWKERTQRWVHSILSASDLRDGDDIPCSNPEV